MPKNKTKNPDFSKGWVHVVYRFEGGDLRDGIIDGKYVQALKRDYEANDHSGQYHTKEPKR